MFPHSPLMTGDKTILSCVVCGMPVKKVRRWNGTHYEHPDVTNNVLPEQDEATAAKLRKERKGKKTVAIVGMAESSCSLAPFNEDVEIWGMNETHAFAWMTRASRWFQMHKREVWTREVAKRDIRGHYEWLRANEWNIPIYMQEKYKEIPRSVKYPLQEVSRLGVKYFTSSLAYCLGLALLEHFKRIELYGFELVNEGEYIEQKACAEFWLGLAIGRGVEVYLPPGCHVLKGELYGY